jgi:hypothetical protein
MTNEIINKRKLRKALVRDHSSAARYIIDGIPLTLHFDLHDEGFIEHLISHKACMLTRDASSVPHAEESHFYLYFLRRKTVTKVKNKYQKISVILEKKAVHYDGGISFVKSLINRNHHAPFFDDNPQVLGVIEQLLQKKETLVCISGTTIILYCQLMKTGVVLRMVPSEPVPDDEFKNYPEIHLLYMIARTMLIGEQRGVMVHGASNACNGEAYLFVAQGNGGKSTISSSLKRYQILSDDISIVSNEGSKEAFKVAPSLWWNDFMASRTDHPREGNTFPQLKRIFFLKKASILAACPLKRDEALRRLLYDDHPMQLMGITSDIKSNTFYFDFLRNLTAHVPCYELEFPLREDLSDDFARLIHALS